MIGPVPFIIRSNVYIYSKCIRRLHVNLTCNEAEIKRSRQFNIPLLEKRALTKGAPEDCTGIPTGPPDSQPFALTTVQPRLLPLFQSDAHYQLSKHVKYVVTKKKRLFHYKSVI